MSPHSEVGSIHRDVPGWVQTTNGYREISVWLGYETTNPYEMKLTFVTSRMVVWRIDRELLRDGLDGPAGHGDVHLVPEREWIRVVLRPPQSAPVHILVDEDALRAFVRETDIIVTPGEESLHLDLDSALGQLLTES